MHPMTDTEWRRFALAGTRTGKLATHRVDGRPHVTPIWFLLDESEGEQPRIVFTTWHDSLKYRALRRDPRFSLCIDDQEPPYSYVMLECVADFTDDPDLLRDWATRIGGRYMGADRAESYGKRNSTPGEYLVRAPIHRAITARDIAA
ncbi:PPOX class F420-dependent oxidoreductase [Nocardia iowensis]|uniref:PPOX class F420-dependent oxidoreductase n=2 Tax=Nocardia iowensis TaxID=204891 RepID=A0ABX8RKB8_NOCIO|nr:PPOX class F420-dependent oxidoreductase [Nocardia iowensis]QXN89359.1 PPOX class F420-dependent oxidoreductase [Nocardia iowensis]